MTRNKLILQESNLNNIVDCASIAILGKRRTGKTTWAMFIIQHFKTKIDRYTVMCGNKDNLVEWKKVVHSLFIMLKDSEQLIEIRDYQDRKCCEFNNNQRTIPRKYKLCIVLDDCGSDRAFMHSNIMKDIVSNGRHYGTTIIILSQYLNQLHPENRDQIDYLCMLHTSNGKNLKKVFEEYINLYDLRTFRYVLNACTVNFGMCFIDNTKPVTRLEEFVFFKRIPDNTKLDNLGSYHVRKYGRNHFAPSIRSMNIQIKPAYEPVINLRYASSTDSDSEYSDAEELANRELLDTMAASERYNTNVFTDNKGIITIQKQKSD